MSSQAFYDRALFPWAQAFEDHYDEICVEAKRQLEEATPLYPSYVETAQGTKSTAVRWFGRTMMFFTIKNESVLAKMPVTAGLLGAVPGVTSAVLLKMEPNTHLKPHCGFSPDVLRCHLGLVVPEPDACVLRVENERRNWRAREWLFFDDYLEHEVWHTGTKTRTVLAIDIIRPGVTHTPRQAGERFFTKVPGIRYEADLDHVAPPSQWLRWLNDGKFPL